ncbi:unnamed protein product [Closterium sp. NIES-64]|nr:unnamed protein product [Closterium sp. NIES-64]
MGTVRSVLEQLGNYIGGFPQAARDPLLGNYIGGFPQAAMDPLLDLMFLPSGLNLNIVRFNIGGGSLPQYSPQLHSDALLRWRAMPGYWPAQAAGFNWTADSRQQAVLLGAKARGVNVFEAFSNSPPWWMTASKDVAGGKKAFQTNLLRKHEGRFARYLVEVVERFRTDPALGNIEFDTLEPFNEALEGYWIKGMGQEGCNFNRVAGSAVGGDSDEEEEGAGSKSSSFSAGDDKEKQRKWRQQSMAKVKELAQQLRSFRTVDLSGKSLGDEGFKYLAESLAFNNSVESVDFSNNGIGPEGSVESVDFSNNGIGPEGVKALTEALATNAYLKTLNLSGNTIGDEGAKVLAGIMEQNRGVQTLQLSSNGIGDEGMRALAEMVKKNEAIVCLEMNNNGIEYEGCAALADALTSTKSLRSLHLNGNYAGTLGVSASAKGLRESSLLSLFPLVSPLGNYAGTLGASALAKGLQENKSLRELHFNGNGVGDEGARVLASGLLARKGKLELLLNGNGVGDEGARVLASGLLTHKGKLELHFNGNGVGDEGARVLASGLLAHKGKLVTIDLSNNSMGSKGAAHIAEVIKKSRSLQWLNLYMNDFGDKVGCGGYGG